MQAFTDARNADTPDEIWVVEHEPVFTQGQAGKAEHILNSGSIPVVQVDRGGQVTYHGPGQLVVYLMVDIRRNKLTIRELVTQIEQSIVALMAAYGVDAYPRADAPGVYVDGKKLCSLGLRVRKGCTFHGLALNVDMDLSPFLRINPCGYAGMEMIQTRTLGGPISCSEASEQLIPILAANIGSIQYQVVEGLETNE